MDYLNALSHLFNTGQGIVIERCPWSDLIFVEACRRHGWFDNMFVDWYKHLRAETEKELLRPHMVIYLDCATDTLLKRIKDRNAYHEQGAKILNKEWLDTIETVYKTQYLPETSRHAELIVYDWNKFGDLDLVIEDLEKVELDHYHGIRAGEKLEDWRITQEL